MAPTLLGGFLPQLSAPREVTPADAAAALGPLAARSVLMGRDDAQSNSVDPARGVTNPNNINNTAMFVFFGFIGAAFVITGIWFFFWARNGGFYFKQDDWDDYKSTVLRRKGPNGTILSGATPSTNLGGGSIYKDMDDGSTEDATTVVSGTTGVTATTGVTGITGGVSDFSGREKRRKKREQKEREKERRREEKAAEKLSKKNKKTRKINEEGVLVDEEAEAEAKAHLRNYRHEKPARVGGLNKEAEGSAWDGSTQPSNSTVVESTVTSELMSHRETTPTRDTARPSHHHQRQQSGGIRKVYSTADRTAHRENERIRAEARRLQEKGRAAVVGRRDFSFQRADDHHHRALRDGRANDDDGSAAADPRTHIPGSWTESVASSSDVGTKSYRHVIPGLSGSATATSDFAYAESGSPKKARPSGYRRGRGGMSEDGR